MVRRRNHIEEVAIREWLRDAHESLGIKNLNAVVLELLTIDPTIVEKSAREFVYGRSVKSEAEKQAILAASVALLERDVDAALLRYESPSTRNFLSALLNEGSDKVPSRPDTKPHLPGQDYLDLVTEHWRSTFNSGSDALKTGIYQVIRRYKPYHLHTSPENGGYDWSDPTNHAVILEIFMLNAERMECLAVTSRMDVYRGSVTLNHEDVLYGAMARTLLGGGRTNFRLFAIKIEGDTLTLHSGISLKAGETSRQPLASECLYFRIPEEYRDLYSVMELLRHNSSMIGTQERAVLMRYVTDIPPNEPYDPEKPGPLWKRVKFVRDFPAIKRLVKPAEGRTSLLREPSRALSLGNVLEISTREKVPVFRWED